MADDKLHQYYLVCEPVLGDLGARIVGTTSADQIILGGCCIHLVNVLCQFLSRLLMTSVATLQATRNAWDQGIVDIIFSAEHIVELIYRHIRRPSWFKT